MIPHATKPEVVGKIVYLRQHNHFGPHKIRVLRIYDRLNQQSAIRFLDYALEKLPLKIEVIQTDHGAEFGSQLHYHVLDGGSATSTSSRPRRG